ncbi:MAG: hypothetical protein AB7O28_21660 [Vicinamibacterales bacterium]
MHINSTGRHQGWDIRDMALDRLTPGRRGDVTRTPGGPDRAGETGVYNRGGWAAPAMPVVRDRVSLTPSPVPTPGEELSVPVMPVRRPGGETVVAAPLPRPAGNSPDASPVDRPAGQTIGAAPVPRAGGETIGAAPVPRQPEPPAPEPPVGPGSPAPGGPGLVVTAAPVQRPRP